MLNTRSGWDWWLLIFAKLYDSPKLKKLYLTNKNKNLQLKP